MMLNTKFLCAKILRSIDQTVKLHSIEFFHIYGYHIDAYDGGSLGSCINEGGSSKLRYKA